MSPRSCVRKALGVLGLFLAVPFLAWAQPAYVTNGLEYAPAGILPGDQVYPSLSLSQSGGFLVWRDNITDGDGYGISAVRLDSSYSPTLGNFRINQTLADDQERPQVALLKNGGAAFVWQGGKQSFQHIYGAFLNSSNTFVNTNGDVLVSTPTNKYLVDPVFACLTNGNVIAAWGSFGQDNADRLQGVYAQMLSPTGQKIGGEFLVNQFTLGNQRTPAVAAFANGNFIITWVSEQQRFTNSVDVYARLYNSAGTPLGNEFLVNTGTNLCADPAVAIASDNTFVITWCEKNLVVRNNSWDIFARAFTSAGAGGVVQRVNTQQYGDQYGPKISSVGTDHLVVWTSLGQDGSGAGIFGQFLHSDLSHAGGEFRVNTTVINHQRYPALGSDGVGRFLAVWSSYTGGLNSMDLEAQRYAAYQAPLLAPDPPFVAPVSSSRLTVTWPPLLGFNVSSYGLYVDGAVSPIAVTNNMWSLTGLAPSSSHTFILDYLLSDGRRSPQSSPAATGMTWGPDDNFDGLPDDWQALYWGASPPSANTQLAPGVTVLQVFLWGADPFDTSTWLRVAPQKTPQGWFLNWNTKPGSIYQVEICTNPANPNSWTILGPPRFAAGATDSVFIGMSQTVQLYRVKRIRF